ncbi:MAG: hypothetical protein GY809_20085 [Planctomycetes bacterium]|nr:hypothetical protein [Planctomycetota bacterium]
MTRRQAAQLSVLIGLIAIALPLAQGWAASPGLKATPMTLEQLHGKQIPLLLRAMRNSQKLLEAGRHDRALIELKKAQDLVAVVQKTLALHVKPEFANTVCPIMGTPLDLANVPGRLMRRFNGEKIAFCCDGCPDQWTKLSRAQREAKLKKAKSTPAQQHVH